MTYTKEEARIAITKLVEDFRAQEATLEKAAEAQIENNYIRPLFRYLNWNTENAGLSHAHYEFKVQVTNKKGLRPDYILNLEGRDVLVMDAKQVKYSMKDPRWLHQVYSYAYSTQNSKPSEKMDFAILTDFQEFIVLDCTLFAAKPEAVNNFRVIDWKYTDYVTKFDELWELFERNNVLEHSRPSTAPPKAGGSAQDEKRGLWSMYLSPQKVKANRISPDKAFLAEMDDEKDGWRVLLAKDMKKRNSAADGELITAAVQLLIDRLIFIKALSDREVDRDYLSEIKDRVTEAGLGENEAGWFKSCKSIFDELNNFYNGSIFAPRPELENVSVSNKVVQSVLTDLQPENSPYNFAVLPVEILGTIYERFLGRVVRTTEKQVRIEEKPEVRKAGGVYYTPQYIVDYIVENTLGKLLEECKTPTDVAKLKVLDPSCGSGSFLLGAYNKLIEWHKEYFEKAGKEKRDRESFYKDESGAIRLTAKLKREILKNNLFGVDIDPQAVEVTRFSLSLKALEDLREGELTEERTLFHQTVLPDLSQNIKNGNSLIGSDYFTGQMFADISEAKLVNAFDWQSEFKEIMGNGGFDCIVGNPPYIRSQTLLANHRDYFNKIYTSATKTYDIYVLFVEKSVSLINEKGKCGFILPNKFFTTDYGEGIRRLLGQQKLVEKILDFEDAQIFTGAGTYTNLLFLQKNSSNEPKYFALGSVFKESGNNGLAERLSSEILFSSIKITDNGDRWTLASGVEGDILLKAQSIFPAFEKFSPHIFQGLKTSADKVYLVKVLKNGQLATIENGLGDSDTIELDILKSVVKGEDVKRYYTDRSQNLFIIYPYIIQDGKAKLISEKDFEQKYPNAWRYINKYKKILGARDNGIWAKRDDWYAYARAQNIGAFLGEKFLLPYMTTRLRVNLDLGENLFFVNITTGGYGFRMEVNEKREYVLGLLNSKFLNYSIQQMTNKFRGGYFAVNKQAIERLPYRAIDFSKPSEKAGHEKMVALVSQMLALHKSKAEAKTQANTDVYERQIRAVDESIDQLVYELYGLTEEEIKIVEGK